MNPLVGAQPLLSREGITLETLETSLVRSLAVGTMVPLVDTLDVVRTRRDELQRV